MALRPRPARAGAALAALAMTALVITVVGSSTAAEGRSAHGPMYRAPEAGTCHHLKGAYVQKRLTTLQRSRSCKKPHTLWVVGVKKVPARIDMDDLQQTNKALWAFVSKACHASWQHSLGKLDRRFGLTAYARYPFFPTSGQRALGAHWVSCELGIYAGKNKLISTRKHRPERLSKHPSNQLRRCGKQNFYFTSCARKHVFRVRYVHVYKATDARAEKPALKYCRGKIPGDNWMYGWIRIGDTPGPRSRYVATCLPVDVPGRVAPAHGQTGPVAAAPGGAGSRR